MSTRSEVILPEAGATQVMVGRAVAQREPARLPPDRRLAIQKLPSKSDRTGRLASKTSSRAEDKTSFIERN